MKIGDQLSSELGSKIPIVLFFVSNFCSKCMYNRNLFTLYLKAHTIIEVNIAVPSEILEEVQPRMAPTHLILDSDKRIIHHSEGVLSDNTVIGMKKLLDNLD